MRSKNKGRTDQTLGEHLFSAEHNASKTKEIAFSDRIAKSETLVLFAETYSERGAVMLLTVETDSRRETANPYAFAGKER